MITIAQVEGQNCHIVEVTVDRRVLGFPVQLVSTRLHHESEGELWALGFYPLWQEFNVDAYLYARGRFAWLLLKGYRKVTRFWRQWIMKPLYWVGVIDVIPGEEFRWGDFWRIKKH
ncbi:hypothetical protein LCGC14_2862110 [marine sediment metagenome]|uniref:Uncharacterized protein n=1 Tax=marine sediment metagenome TaxID=412755 RepID=A0A0F9ADN3_9ZZZZ